MRTSLGELEMGALAIRPWENRVAATASMSSSRVLIADQSKARAGIGNGDG